MHIGGNLPEVASRGLEWILSGMSRGHAQRVAFISVSIHNIANTCCMIWGAFYVTMAKCGG